MSSAILLHLRTHLSDHFLGECTVVNRDVLAYENFCYSSGSFGYAKLHAPGRWAVGAWSTRCEDEAAMGIITIRRIFISVWRHGWDSLTSLGQPVEKCGMPLSLSSPCTHFMCYLHMRRRLRQQMLQKRESVNIYSDSAQLLISTPPPLSFVSYSWGRVWVGFCLTCTFGTQLWWGGGVVSALGSRNLVIKSILTCSSRAVKHSTSAREPLTWPEWEKGANCRHPPLNEVYLHEPLMK